MFKRVAVGMSGGVDSAVAALLLKNKGFNVTGVFMKNWDIIDETGICTTEQDYEDAKWVCNKLNIPLIQVNFVKEYWTNVFSDLVEKYQNGYTPNPDVLCNKNIKFDKFYHLVREQFGADAIATGHYVRSSFGPYLENFQANTNVHLLKAEDAGKDQSFFLCQVPQETLRHYMFPLGDYLKTDIKKIAHEAGLNAVAQKKESAGICFVGRREFQSFISEYIEDKPGNFIDLDTGAVVGKHRGIHHWTVGQRCRISGSHNAYFIFHKNVRTNDIIVAHGTDHPALYTDFLIGNAPHWISEQPEELKNNFHVLECEFRFQHRNPLIPCKVFQFANKEVVIRLSEPLRAVTKGQFAVFYRGEECLGSSMIECTGPTYFALEREINSLASDTCEDQKKMASVNT